MATADQCSEVPLDFLKELAQKAGNDIKQFIGQSKTVSPKSSKADLVTEFDVQIENELRAAVSLRFPTHSFLCEESAAVDQRLTDDPTWIMDPIDGTTNFVHTNPLVCVSIAFAVKRQVLHGVVYNPMMDAMFSASRGQGAYLNDKKISTSQCAALGEALCSMGFCISKIRKVEEFEGKSTKEDLALLAKLKEVKECVHNNFSEIIPRCQDIRAIGTCALACSFVAAGYLDFYCQICIKEWDFAAGVLLVQEAGGHTCCFDGSPLGDMHDRQLVVASSKKLAEEALAVLRCPKFNLVELD